MNGGDLPKIPPQVKSFLGNKSRMPTKPKTAIEVDGQAQELNLRFLPRGSPVGYCFY
jgi:hypothetical protein